MPKLKDYLHVVTDNKNRALVGAVVDEFTRQISPISHTFRKGNFESFQIKNLGFKVISH